MARAGGASGCLIAPSSKGELLAAVQGTVNRAYYAMFYALLALLATWQRRVSKHSGAHSLSDCKFIKTALFTCELSRALHLILDRRQGYDYGEMIAITEEMAAKTLRDARVFIVAVEPHLRATGHLTGQA